MCGGLIEKASETSLRWQVARLRLQRTDKSQQQHDKSGKLLLSHIPRLLIWFTIFAFASNATGQTRPLGGRIKEVLVLHHSHLDIGFTHPQPMLWELQREFIDEALQLLDETSHWPELSQPRWTCEVTAQVSKWLETASASDVAKFAAYVKQGRIGISALEYNTTPLCTAEQLARQLMDAKHLRQQFGAKINTANCHDVNGLPWTVVDLLLDSGVELLIMGINLHLGGSPQPRPGVYRWRGPSGRELLVMNGEHYTMFDQWLHPEKNDLDVLSRGLDQYLQLLEQRDYTLDFIYLTSTNAPFAYDNSPPNLDVAKLIRQWNDQKRQPTMRYVTPEQLLDRIRQLPRESLPVVAGDWTDFWNFGCASSAFETRLTRNVQADLFVTDLLHAFNLPDANSRRISRQVWDDLNLYAEHTWGAFNSMNPDHPLVSAQWNMKAHPVHEARALADYLLVHELDRLADNPPSAWQQQGVLIVNPNASSRSYPVAVPNLWRFAGKRLRTSRLRSPVRAPNLNEATVCGPVELAPYSWKVIPIQQLKPVSVSDEIEVGDHFIQSRYYRLTFDPSKGRITQLWDRQRDRPVLDESSPWSFFQLVHEHPDPQVDGSRKAFFDRDVRKERYGITCWKPDWKAVYQSTTDLVSCRVEKTAQEATLRLRFQAPGLEELEQRIAIAADSPVIQLTARFRKLDVRTPESLYFAFPLKLPAGWRGHFDTAAIPTELDAQQLRGTCRDWVTVDSYVSMHHTSRGATLYCPDAPMVQIGDFNFGRIQAAIERRENPLLLAWPLNNYWDTNFRASQPGFIELRYGFRAHGSYDPVRAVRDARDISNPPLVHPAIECAELREGHFFRIQGAGIDVVHVKRAEDGQGTIFRLLNLNAKVSQCELRLGAGEIESACICSPLEEEREPLAVREGSVRVSLPPRTLTTIRVR